MTEQQDNKKEKKIAYEECCFYDETKKECGPFKKWEKSGLFKLDAV